MAHKRLRHSEMMVPPGADDFKLINGIGPGVAQRLYNAGITTFAQLADLSLDEIASLVADLAGLSAERVAKQDWIGQARELALERSPAGQRADLLVPAPPEPQDVIAIPENRQHYAMFNVELLLNEENDVRRTRVTHVQDGSEDSWAGWQDARLIDFFVQCAALNLSLAVPLPSIVEAVEEAAELALVVEEAVEEAAAAREALPTSFAGALRLREFELVPAGDDASRRMLHAGQPFTIDLTLDLADVTLPDDTVLDYTVTIYAKKMGGGRNQTMTEARGAILAADTVTISIEGTPLAEGLYRIEGVVAINLPHAATTARGGLRAMIEGDLFQVY